LPNLPGQLFPLVAHSRSSLVSAHSTLLHTSRARSGICHWRHKTLAHYNILKFFRRSGVIVCFKGSLTSFQLCSHVLAPGALSIAPCAGSHFSPARTVFDSPISGTTPYAQVPKALRCEVLVAISGTAAGGYTHGIFGPSLCTVFRQYFSLSSPRSSSPSTFYRSVHADVSFPARCIESRVRRILYNRSLASRMS